MAKLVHKKEIILENMSYLTSVLQISYGLMFAGKKKVDKGVCLVMPSVRDVKYGSAVTMFFCFHPLDILFINSEYEVVDKVTLRPWVPSYTPKKAAKYIVESTKGKFEKINIGDKLEIKKI